MRLSILFVVLSFCGSAFANDGCDLKQLQSSKLDISVKDTEYLKSIMAFSYENEAPKFIPDMKSSFSGMYFKESAKSEPLATYFFASYKSPKTAKQASEYLKARWLAHKNNQYDVVASGNDVLWLGNNSLSAGCFKKVVAAEKAKVFKK